MRWEILYKYGGFAVDADSECMTAFDDGPIDFFAEPEKVMLCYENESVRPGMVGCGFIRGPKGHPFFRRCIDSIKTEDMLKPAWTTVGPMLATKVASEMPDEVIILPARHFNPMHYSGTPAPGDGHIYARQQWGGTKGYNQLRKRPCLCKECWPTALKPPWA
jgi:mannosyltransferase OCH1-like enzyme